MNELKLIEDLRSQLPKAQRALVKRYHAFLFSIAFKVVRNQMDAEDIMQESFLKILKSIDLFNPENSFKGWMGRITHNTAITHYNRNKRFNRYEDLTGFEPMQVKASNFFDALTAKDDYRHAMKLLQHQAPGQYMYTRLYFEEQMDYDEIADDLEVPVGSVKSQVSRGCSKIRSFLRHKPFNYN